ncbi:Polyprenol-phosphate-mannose-dependent alpha-(1-2)-phosphatidylinositol pentamannoside mannosyltransferase [Mycobacterium talmoniae]|uniref:Polyprenol-phosphate-mannose-dependent alpha-(1-2)-phosphatidylinositol pentamannoside mannosyltransferase n=1 Tax=Mycobacterium talmoniae TaxID=1858794 RepID=A0A2S8BQ47_9MYCO|nr:Polyprenol-phosphate-mannose-dependent alpha-(1-2)-phosphatidylinositol pentamannoside mannosyltransferase [Mycobacterium talmoniae]
MARLLAGACGRVRRPAKVDPVDALSNAAPAAAPARQSTNWLTALAPLLLLASVGARLGWTYLAPNGANFVDLHVYIGGAAALDHPGTLYSYTYADQTPDFPLPFTYPPFAAIVFYPLHLLPFGVVAFCWQVGTMAALYGLVRLSQRMLGARGGRSPRRDAVDGGGDLDRAATQHFRLRADQCVAGAGRAVGGLQHPVVVVGSVGGRGRGVKLTPAITGVYFVGVRRWAAAVFSAVVFLASIAVSFWVAGDETRYYFTELIGDPDRIGPVATSFNQSWRGGISRIIGHDAGYDVLVLAALAVTALVAILAWRALRTGRDQPDRLGLLLVVELFGLLLSPISWTHHWVWLVPLMIWLIHGPLRERRGARILGWGWLVLLLIGVPWLLSFAQPSIWQEDRPWYLAWAGLVYIVATLATLGWIATTGRRACGEGAESAVRAPSLR